MTPEERKRRADAAMADLAVVARRMAKAYRKAVKDFEASWRKLSKHYSDNVARDN